MKIGPLQIGRTQTTTSETIEVPEQIKKDTLGGFLDFGKKTLSGEKSISSKLLEANTGWVYRNNDVIAKEVAGIEFELYKVKYRGGQLEYEEIVTHPLLDILDRFNDSTSLYDGMYITQSHKKLAGDAFWYLDGSGTNIKNIFILQPDKVDLVIGDPTDSSDALVEAYEYKDNVDGKQIKKIYSPDEIIQFKTPNPKNPFRGYGAVEAAAETIDIDNLTQATSKKFYENGAIQNFVLTTEQKLTQEQLKRLRHEFRSNYGGAANAFKTMILGGGIKPESIQMSNKDQEFIALQEWYRDKIMVIFGNNKSSLGILDDVNRASNESGIISWRKNAIKPEMQAIVNTLNEFLVPRFGKDLVLTFCDPVGEDRDAIVNEAVRLSSTNIISTEEAREMLGFEGPAPEAPEATEVPKSLKNIPLAKVLRKRGIYHDMEVQVKVEKDIRKVAEKIVKKRKQPTQPKIVTVEEKSLGDLYTDEVMEFHEKRLSEEERVVEQFKNKLTQFISKVKDEVLASFPENAPKSYKKELFNDDELEEEAVNSFAPILLSLVAIVGASAMRLAERRAGSKLSPYIPTDMQKTVEKNVRAFAKSMLDTEKDKMVDIISMGIDEGLSIPEIRRNMQEAFDQLNKTQTERIARTEISRASVESSLDAYEQSGVVEALQWVTYGAVDECADYEGQTVTLGDKFYSTEEFKDGYPPIHPNCKCDVIPIVDKEKSIKETEKLIKKNKKLQKKYKELEDYTKELEGLVNGDQEAKDSDSGEAK